MTMAPAPRLEWSDALLLGHGPMDRTHREFVEIVDAMLLEVLTDQAYGTMIRSH